MIRDDLRSKTRKQLGDFAKKLGLTGWHALSKDALIEAILRRLRSKKTAGTSQLRSRKLNSGRTRRESNGHQHSNGSTNGKNGRKRSPGKSGRRQTPVTSHRVASRILPASLNGQHGPATDRLIAKVRDPYWIYVQWTLTPRILERAAAALGPLWHESVPVLRVFDVTSEDGTQGANSWVQDIEVHGGVNDWYVPVMNPPRSYEIHLGYRGPTGQFFVLARSQKVNTPEPGSVTDAANEINGTYSQTGSARGNGQRGAHRHLPQLPQSREPVRNGRFDFQIQTELIVRGSTHPDATLTLLGEPIPLEKDGTFALRLTLPDGRQVIPAVATTPDGAEQRTIVLGVERNTKELEPLLLDEPMN